MTGWKTAKLVDIAAKRRWALNGGPFGSKLTTKYYADSGVPVIRGTNLSGGTRFSFEDFVWVSEEKADELLPNNAHPGDLVFTQRGTVGQVGLIPLDSPFKRFVISQNQMKLTPDPTQVDVLFLYYFFSSASTVTNIQNLAFAAGVPHINLDILRNFEVPIPPLPIQRRIAGTLSAYDDLIENCQRRIRTLEQMARGLYREWFVNFRFPNHAKTPMVDSPLGNIPKGWEVMRLDAVVEDIVDYRGKTPTKLNGDWTDEGILALSALNVKGGRLVNLEKSKHVDEDLYVRWMKKPLRQGDILMTSEAPLGELFFLCTQERYCLSQRLFSIRANPKFIAPVMLYHNLESEQTQHELRSRASGATVSGIRQSELRNVPVLVPSPEFQQHAVAVLQHLAEQKSLLATQLLNLRKTRDLLLPRLMSGQINVN